MFILDAFNNLIGSKAKNVYQNLKKSVNIRKIIES